MTSGRGHGCAAVAACVLMFALSAAPARADEIWVTPTAQQDLGGPGIGSNTVWPATAVGAVRLAWSVPENLQFFKHAKLVLIPHGSGDGQVHVIVCPAQNNDPVVGPNCITPPGVPYAGTQNRLTEVDISGWIGPSVGAAGKNYLAVLAYTTPNTATDHIVGLRFEYEPTIPAGMATTGANTFSGTQTAPAFVGNGSGLTNLPFPAGAATLGANAFSGTQTAPAFAGSGASLTGVAKLSANTFTGTQTIDSGNLDLDNSTATSGNLTKGGISFLHDFGSSSNVFLGREAGNFTSVNANENSAVGAFSLRSLTFGLNNAAFGFAALQSNTYGNGNVALGVFAMNVNQTGNDNVAIGVAAGDALQTGSNNIYIGGFTHGWSDESNAIYLGVQGLQTKTTIAGIRGTTTGAADAIPVVIDSNGQLGTISSSIRFKEDVRDMADMSRRLFDLRPVTFRYTKPYADGSKPMQFGLVAEEVAAVFPELAVRDASGNVETVHYETLNVLLLNELRKEHEEVQQQRQRLEVLEQQLSELLQAR